MNIQVRTGHPQDLAYNMARFSRSADSYDQIEASRQEGRERNFYETNYTQYGHASIGDMAHVAVTLENISFVAAQELEAEQLWDGQERSTRYQDFGTDIAVFQPDWLSSDDRYYYDKDIVSLSEAYLKLHEAATNALQDKFPMRLVLDTVSGLTPPQYYRTIKSRAFDVARAMLPLGTLTSVGQITSARTLLQQGRRLAIHPILEVAQVGKKLLEVGAAEVPYLMPDPFQDLDRLFQIESRMYEIGSMVETDGYVISSSEGSVNEIYLFESNHPWATALLYTHSNQAWDTCEGWLRENVRYQQELAALAIEWRAVAHQERIELRIEPKQRLFKIEADMKSLQDLRRHRRQLTLAQPLNVSNKVHDVRKWFAAGTDSNKTRTWPLGVLEAESAAKIAGTAIVDTDGSLYATPTIRKQRMVVQMDPVQVAYVVNLRSKPQGHFAYRNLAHQLHNEYQEGRNIEPLDTNPVTFNLHPEVLSIEDWFRR